MAPQNHASKFCFTSVKSSSSFYLTQQSDDGYLGSLTFLEILYTSCYRWKQGYKDQNQALLGPSCPVWSAYGTRMDRNSYIISITSHNSHGYLRSLTFFVWSNRLVRWYLRVWGSLRIQIIYDKLEFYSSWFFKVTRLGSTLRILILNSS